MESKKRLFLTPRFLLPMGTVLLLIGGFLFYYFLIIGHQQASLDDRAFRSLAALSGQLRDLVSNYAEVMQRSPEKEFPAFVAEQVPDLKVDDACPEPGLSVRPILRSDGYALQFVNKRCGHVRIETALAPLLSKAPGQIFDEVFVATSKGRVLYQTQATGVIASDLSPFLQTAQGGAQPKNALPARSGEEADSGSKGSGTEKDTPYSPAFAAASQSSNLVTISLGGTSYRAYLVPVPLAANDGEDSRGKAILVLCGLVRQERFEGASRSIPGTALTTMVLTVLLVIVATWPLLKFSTMRRTERVPRSAALYYALSATATIVMMIVLVIDVRYVFYDPETDANLKSLAEEMDKHLGQELKQALQVMDGIVRSPLFTDKKFKPQTGDPVVCSPRQDAEPDNLTHDLLQRSSVQLADYPYFRRFFAYDKEGFEQIKWTVDATDPPKLRVCDRPYFTGTLRNDLWYFKGDIGGARFRVDPIYSKLSGEYLAVVAQAGPPVLDSNPDAPRVLTMVTPLLSLILPVLPPDYGFAVIDESGKILFHSDVAKNGRANFFDESRASEELRAVVTARREALLTVNYSGSDHRVFVRPLSSIQQSPWFLITFSNLSAVGAERVERSLLFSALVLIYFALVIVPCALMLMFRPPQQVLWIWPCEEKRGSYHHLILTLLLVMLLFYALMFQASPWELLVFALLIPGLSVVLGFFKLTGHEEWIAGTAGALALAGLVILLARIRSEVWKPFMPYMLMCAVYFFLSLKPVTERLHRWSPWSFVTSFSLACFCLLVVGSAPPSVALFKAAYDYEENVATRREQLLTVQALEKREERVINQYFKVKISDENSVFAGDLGKWLFLRRRLEDQKLDVYDTVFQDQQAGQIFKAGGPTEHQDPPALLGWLAAHLPFSDASLTSKLNQNAAQLSQWEWDNEGTNRIRIHRQYDPKIEKLEGSPQSLALAKLVFRDPVFATQDLAYDLQVLQPWPFFVAVAAPLFVLLWGMFFSVRSTLCKMFLIGMKMPDALPESTLDQACNEPGSFILLGLPCSEKTKVLEFRKDISLVDVALFLQGKDTVPAFNNKIVALDHFEFGMDDDSLGRKKLDLLEQLVRDKKKVLIITTIDPLFYLESAANGSIDASVAGRERSRTLQRWGRVLANFSTRLLKCEPATRSKACYRILWSTFTRNEQAAFYGLAHDGWANHKNHEALEHLLQRGLICRSPMFQIAPEHAGLGEFISGAVSREERNSWDVSQVPGYLDWDGLRVVFIILLSGTVAAVLFFNQHEVLGYITSAISAVLPVAKLFTDMRGSRGVPAAKAEGAAA